MSEKKTYYQLEKEYLEQWAKAMNTLFGDLPKRDDSRDVVSWDQCPWQPKKPSS